MQGLRLPIRWLLLSLVAVAIAPRYAEAIPPFASQTGMACVSCHIGGYGPQLTPLGRMFKLGGYTQSGGEGWDSYVPIAFMAQTTFTNTTSGFPSDMIPHHYNINNNFSLDQVSGFIGGHIGDYTGAFIQFTWSGVDNTYHLDNMDLRPFTTIINAGGKDLRVGVTVNNSPTVQDPWNSTFAWGFPYIASGIAPTPAADVMLSSGFNQNALGYTAYAWWDNALYAEAGVYTTLSSWALGRIGNGYGVGSTTSPAPYVRVAYEKQWGDHSAHIGTIFMHADVNPVTDTMATTSAFGQDHYTDIAFDIGYQYVGGSDHIFTFDAIYTHENQNLTGSAAMEGEGLGSNYSLNQIRANASYWYKNTYGATVAWQNTWGPMNPVLYSPGPLYGSANGKPNSNAFILEADWVPFGKEDSWLKPFANLKLGIQYTIYTQFNGGSSNYDGFGHNASGNNTLLLFAWLVF